MGRARNHTAAVVATDRFDTVLGARRGGIDDDVSSRNPGPRADAEFARLRDPAAVGEAVAALSVHYDIIDERPLLQELRDHVLETVHEKSFSDQLPVAERNFSLLGVSSARSDVVVEPASGRGKLHIWPEGAEVGPWQGPLAKVGTKTLCGKPFSDLHGGEAFKRAGKAAWNAGDSGQRRCKECWYGLDKIPPLEALQFMPDQVAPMSASALNVARNNAGLRNRGELDQILKRKGGDTDLQRVANRTARMELAAVAGRTMAMRGIYPILNILGEDGWEEVIAETAGGDAQRESAIRAMADIGIRASLWEKTIALAVGRNDDATMTELSAGDEALDKYRGLVRRAAQKSVTDQL